MKELDVSNDLMLSASLQLIYYILEMHECLKYTQAWAHLQKKFQTTLKLNLD